MFRGAGMTRGGEIGWCDPGIYAIQSSICTAIRTTTYSPVGLPVWAECVSL